jgi:hypothetical protein
LSDPPRYIERASLDLVEDASHVLADDSQRDQLNPREEEQGDGKSVAKPGGFKPSVSLSTA